MRNAKVESQAVSLSLNIYKLLLFAYPSGFQQEYSSHMMQVFGDCCLRAVNERGLPGILQLWTLTILDFFSSIIEQYMHKETQMNKSKFIRLSGWALTLGGFFFLIGLVSSNYDVGYFDPIGGGDAIYEYGAIIGLLTGNLFFVIGMLGMFLRYSDEVSSIGKASLIVGVISSVVSLAGGVGMLFGSDDWWPVWAYSFVLMFASLLVFGIVALRDKPLPRWNALPIFVGIWLPLLFLVSEIYERITGDWLEIDNIAGFLIFLAVAIGLGLLGYTLQDDSHKEVIPT
jgi:hypothetical protein